MSCVCSLIVSDVVGGCKVVFFLFGLVLGFC